MNENKKKLLKISLVLVSDNIFDVEIYESESGKFNIIKCHDDGLTVERENKEISDEIRSWVSMMR